MAEHTPKSDGGSYLRRSLGKRRHYASKLNLSSLPDIAIPFKQAEELANQFGRLKHNNKRVKIARRMAEEARELILMDKVLDHPNKRKRLILAIGDIISQLNSVEFGK